MPDGKETLDVVKNALNLGIRHIDTVSHLTVTRQDIRSLGLSNVHVPEDNEVLSF